MFKNPNVLLIAMMLRINSFFFFLNDTAPPEIYPLPLHAAFPIWGPEPAEQEPRHAADASPAEECQPERADHAELDPLLGEPRGDGVDQLAIQEQHLEQGDRDLDAHHRDDLSERSEEHTSELQSQSNLVCRLLLEKKKNINAGRLPTSKY